MNNLFISNGYLLALFSVKNENVNDDAGKKEISPVSVYGFV